MSGMSARFGKKQSSRVLISKMKSNEICFYIFKGRPILPTDEMLDLRNRRPWTSLRKRSDDQRHKQMMSEKGNENLQDYFLAEAYIRTS